MPDTLIVIQKYIKRNQSPAQTEGDHERSKKIHNDVVLIRLPCFAVVLRAAALAFDMREHGRTKCASPPCIADFLCIILSTIRAGCILNWVFHKFFSIIKIVLMISISTIFILRHTTSKSHLCRGVPTRSFKVHIEYGRLFLFLIVAQSKNIPASKPQRNNTKDTE